jgi:plasmid stabilization system protein ParE
VTARSLRLHPDVERDLADGLAFYASHSPIAAERFLDEVEAALEVITAAPERWPLHGLGMRRYVPATFPYSIVYRVSGTAIEVYAVAHAKRRPFFWRRRRL